MRKLLLVVVGSLLTLAPTLLAQQGGNDSDAQTALAASRKRLENALTKTASLQDTAFSAEWGPTKKAKNNANNNPFALLLGGMSSGKASGSWHPQMSLCNFDGDEGDELVTAGRHTIARSDNHDWARRSGRFADGNTISFAPDIELLLRQLDDWNLAVLHRDTGSIDDRPVEIVTVTLNADQVTEAIWSRTLPSALVTGFAGGIFRFAAGGAMGGGRQAPDKPKAVVDVAIAIDPARSLVHRLQFRAYTDENARGGMGGAVIIRRVGNVLIDDDEEEEEEEEEEIDESGPMQFENGLPKRSRKKKSVSDYTIRLADHGTKTAPGLSDTQKKLLQIK